MEVEDIQKYLPKYLSATSQREMFEDVKKFIDTQSDGRFFTNILDEEKILFQGDGAAKFKFFNFEREELKVDRRGVILSNTCDIDLANERYVESQILYSPIIPLVDYVSLLKAKNISDEKIEAHLVAIRKQEITHVFYLPKNGEIFEESLVFFDRISNMQNSVEVRDRLLETKLFTLSNFGFYLFLLKLSIHFTRIKEGVDRKTA